MKFYTGDLVRIGKGKVEYVVTAVTEERVSLLAASGKVTTVDPERLTLIEGGSAREEPDSQVRKYSGLTEFTVEGHEHQESEYGRSILKALQLKVNVFLGGLSPASKTKRQNRRAKNKVAKASRKANR